MRPSRVLGTSGISLTPIGLGCWQFSGGEGLAGRYWPSLSEQVVAGIVTSSLDGGVNWFDTAEMYGDGNSEESLARALAAAGRKAGEVVIATKWWPLLRTSASIRASIDERLRRLAPFGIDLHQVHNPLALASTTAQMNAMADLVAEGKVRTVGVSNFSAARMRSAHRALAARGIPLVSNQMPYSLLNRRLETSGVLDAARELGITIIAYSPLAQGLLTGKFHRDPELAAARPGPRRWLKGFRRRGLERSRPLVTALEAIARDHGATPAQVALNWLVHAHGECVVAIPGATRVEQAKENAGAVEFELGPAEMARLDLRSRELGPGRSLG